METKTALRPPLPNLTSIRFFAAATVFLFHANNDKSIFRWGHVGVNLFFVLSGFILAYNNPTSPNCKKFYASRFARIYPLYFTVILVTLPATLRHLSGGVMRGILGLSLTLSLLQGWWIPLSTFTVPPAWTLSHEAFFYAFFPFVLPWLVRNLHHWKLLSVLFWFAMVGSSTFIHFLWIPSHPQNEVELRYLLMLPVFRAGEFLIGVLFGLHFERSRKAFSGWAVTASALTCVPFLYLVYLIPRSHMEVATCGLVALPFATLIYTLAGWKSATLSHPLLQLGGEISYGIYLFQLTIVGYFNFLMRRSGYVTHEIFAFPLIILAAYGGYLFIEKPARVFILSRLGYRTHPKPIETTVTLP